ncbi:hypothetical protein QJU43_04885 [Pasteurella atlantica]|uniref:Uncharacterized protein n=3 Tax=Pasteurellaceae TaxID=712 RepID=A0AAJ6N916_9PAST|nr:MULTISPECIES: hypothetical protein [Pasteurella]MDP8034356.1 hypothetical protein [Pasteurella atlantica]MDP8036259.1 hypothetical protein [Pasteurella atlantica]MDP8038239.1 hypothetical protein [Pasteurella atlantica]MDP8048564.1 hypothetical protein [Pasteurella atlantica]MDP8050550.1 hypothetical protein [Pasteurella atlantica]
MSLLTGQPHLQYCNKCGWKNKNIIVSDCLFIRDCPKCNSHLSLKPLSSLSWIEKTYLKVLKTYKGNEFL